MNMKTTGTTTTTRGVPPAPPEAHQTAGGHSFERNRIFFLNMMGAAAQTRVMMEWVFDEGLTAPAAVTSAVWAGIRNERDNAALYLQALGGLAAAW